MDGNQPHQEQVKDFKDPFNAGQMVGMLVILTFLEQNNGIPQEALDKLKEVTANNAQIFIEKPVEDIFLMIDNLVKEIGQMQ